MRTRASIHLSAGSHNKHHHHHQPLAFVKTNNMAASIARGDHRQDTITMNHSPQRSALSDAGNSHRRARSRAIAIQRNPHPQCDEHDFEENLGSALVYEEATWRMYNRIVDHRQKHPVSAHYDAQVSTALSSSQDGYNVAVPVMQLAPNSSLRRDNDPLDGEIFDIEL
jgi:hypothetical protein